MFFFGLTVEYRQNTEYRPKVTHFHWNCPYEQIDAVFGLESGCIDIW